MRRMLAAAALVCVMGAVTAAYDNRDIGGVTVQGFLEVNGDTYSVHANGADIWGSADAFHYVYVPLEGDGEISAKVSALQWTDSWTKAGVMIRATLDPGSTYAYMSVTGTNGAAFQWRPMANSADGLGNLTTGGISAPHWVRVVRQGNTFYGYHSFDGSNWSPQGQTTISMPTNVYMGLAVTSHTAGALCRADFDSVKGFAPAWKALNVYPPDNARQIVPENLLLQWQASPDAPGAIDHFNVYLSNDPAAMGRPQGLFALVDAAANQVAAGTLAGGTTWYWRVDSVISDANMAEGAVWHFTTLVEPIEVCPEADINGDCRVDFGDVLPMALQWLDEPGCTGHPADCADIAGNDGVNLGDLARMAAQWDASAGPVVINEIHYDPLIKTDLAEFVELHNVTKQTVDLSGWELAGVGDCVFGEAASIPPGGHVIAAQDAQKFQAKFGFAPAAVFTGRLSNDGERVRLRNAAGDVIDEVSYKLGFPWPTVGDLPGNSIQLINPGFDNNLGGSWRSALPTPGEANLVLSANSPPHMRQVKHAPGAPRSDEPVTISVKVTDADGVAAVMLAYQIVDPNAYISIEDDAYDADWTSVAMYDDGLGGDEEAGDDVYTVIMPASIQVHRRLVRYRITATDTIGLSITGPYTDDPCPNFAYFVYDGVPPWTAAINPWAAQPQYITYGADVMRSLPVYHLISKKTDVETATWLERYGGSEYKWRGTLVYDGAVYDHIRYRMRGGVWRYAMGKNMWKFDFNRGHYFQARDDYGQKYDTKWDKLNFSACIQQGDYLHRGEQGMFEAVGFKMFNLMGVEAPKTHWLQFRIIDETSETGPDQYGGDLWGLYMAIEQMDGRFLDEHNLPDGNLYKIEGHNGELNNQGPTAVTNGSDLNAFKSGYYYDPNPTEQWWRDNVDLEGYYSYRCVVEGIHHGDIGYGKNYFFYLNPETSRWSMLPWDLDLTWANNMYGNGEEPFKNQGAIFANSALRIEYDNRLREFHDLFYNTDQACQLIEEYAAIIDPPGQDNTFVDVDRRMWDYHPIMSSQWVNWGKAGAHHFYDRAPSRDFRGMVQIMKDYVANGPRQFDSYYEDPSIPHTPEIEYIGQSDYAVNDLTFRTSAFGDPQGAGTFGAMTWRLAEVEPFSVDVPPAQTTILIPEGASWRYFKGTEEPSAQTGAWRLAGYNDNPASTNWRNGDAPVGYDASVAMGTSLSDMRYNYSTFYMRKEFQVTDPAAIGSLKLYAMYDDGFNVWINGTRVAFAPEPDLPENMPHNAQLDVDLPNFSARENSGFVEFSLPDPADYLVAGANIIAIHVYNAHLRNSSDCFMDVRLIAEPPSGQEPPAEQTVLLRPGRYEITPVWESGEITTYQDTVTIPASAVRSGRTYRVRARFKDNTHRWSHWSAPVQFAAGEPMSAGILQNLRITEVMYNPAKAPGSDYNNDDFELIELKNIGDEVLDLSAVSFTDGVTFDFSAGAITSIDPGAILLVVRNQAAFESRYGTALSSQIAGAYTGSLNNDGENLRLEDFWNGVIAEFDYNDGWGWPLAADGGGHSLVPLDAALPGQPDGSCKYGGNWRASAYRFGSPGADDPTPPATMVLNEIMAHTDYVDPTRPEYDSNDWIELYNVHASSVTLDGDWYLSDDIDDLKKWALPNVDVPAGGRISFDEVSGFHNPITAGFGLNKGGEQVYLSYLPGTSHDRIVDAVRFKGQDVTTSYGRYPDGGDDCFYLTPTQDAPNDGPVAGIVISEIMYNPAGDNEEYVELTNPTAADVALYGVDGAWRMDGAISFTFESSVWLEAGGKIVLVPFDPAAEPARLDTFMSAHGVTGLAANVNTFGPFTGNLSNGGERLALERPLAPDLPDPTIPWVVLDEVIYGDCDPWPTTPDGQGDALMRISADPTISGNNPTNWQSATPSPGQ